MDVLSRIPLLSGLLNSDNTANLDTAKTLLDWINQKDQESSLASVAEKCLAALDRFDENSLNELSSESLKTIELSNNAEMTLIKGLEDRFFGLETIMLEAKRLVTELTDLSCAIYQNQQRASNLKDRSIFPDLCKSHRAQLQHMLKNHQQLRDIRRRCAQAKVELSSNIHARLRWIMFVERRLADVDSKVLIYRETIRRLKRHLEMIQQVHIAPRVYLSAIVEVVRRRKFSGAFLPWAQRMAELSSNIHRKEKQNRSAFTEDVSSHFVCTLFPGLNDMPPPYAVDAPEPFDLFLPQLTLDDVNQLAELLPEYSDLLRVGDQAEFATMCMCNMKQSENTDASMIDQDQSVQDKLMADLEEHVKTRDVQQQRIAELEQQLIVKNGLEQRIAELEEQLKDHELLVRRTAELEQEILAKGVVERRVTDLEAELASQSNMNNVQKLRIEELELQLAQYREREAEFAALQEQQRLSTIDAQRVSELEEKLKTLTVQEERIKELEDQLKMRDNQISRIVDLEDEIKLKSSQARQAEELEEQLRAREALVLQLQAQCSSNPTITRSLSMANTAVLDKVAVLR